ncbi:MAG: hypothetical protein U0163_15775 [Gemmatimonadaceae bacterium]
MSTHCTVTLMESAYPKSALAEPARFRVGGVQQPVLGEVGVER